MQPIEFNVRMVSEKMYRRFVCYHCWLRIHPVILGLIITLFLFFAVFLVAAAEKTGVWLLFWGLFMLLPAPRRRYESHKKYLAAHWEYTFQENDFIARMHETNQAWKYSALDYAHEARDAFYLVLNEKSFHAMLIPKDELTDEQCAALTETLQQGVPEGRFTRAGARPLVNRKNIIAGVCLLSALICVLAGLNAAAIVLKSRKTDEPPAYCAYTDDITSPEQETSEQEPYSPLSAALEGESVIFGSMWWVVLEKSERAVLLITEGEMNLLPGGHEALLAQLNEGLGFGDTVLLGAMRFTTQEFNHIRKSPEGDAVFLLAPQEMERYGVEPPEDKGNGLTAVRPAIWVQIGGD